MPLLPATWGLGGRRFNMPDLRHSLNEDKIVRPRGLVPRSDVERGELTDISIKI